MIDTAITGIDSHLVSYAFLKADAQNNKDYYDYFVPFINEVLLNYDEVVVTANNIQVKLHKEFKIELPIKVVDTIIRRFNRKGILYKERNVLKIDKERINNSNFIVKKQQILTQHSMLIEALIKYANEHYNEKFEFNNAEQSLYNLINQNALTFLKDMELNNEESLVLHREDNRNGLITANFIGYIYNENLPMYNHLLEIVKGHMLLKAIYMVDGKDLDRLKMKFNKTEIFFDTTFILYALGYSGPELKKPCLELLKLLSDSKAILRCFSHNVDEARGVLEFCKKNINNPNVDRFGTIATFIENKFDEFDIDEIIFNLEKAIKSDLNLDIVSHVPYDDYKNVIKVEELTEHLNKEINYKSKRALETDVDSISAIVRLRKGNRSIYIEECQALFVTTNYRLANSSRKYFSDTNEPKIITPVIHDSLLMNLVWLKNPQIAPNLPSSILMADCYAAGQPSKKLWTSYFSILDTLKDSGQISEEKVLMLKYSQGIKALVMDETLGNEELMTVGSVNSILEKIEKQIEIEKQLAVDKEREQQESEKSLLKEKLNTLTTELTETTSALNEQTSSLEILKNEPNMILSKIARNRARTTKIILLSIIFLLITAVVICSTFFMNEFSMMTKLTAIIIVTVFPIILTILGISFKKPIKKLEQWLIDFYEKRLLIKYK